MVWDHQTSRAQVLVGSQSRSMRPDLGPSWPNRAQVLAKSGPGPSKVAPKPWSIWSDMPDLGQVGPKSCSSTQVGVDLAPSWARLGNGGPKSWQSLVQVAVDLARLDQVGPKSQSTWPRLGPDSAKSGPGLCQVGPKSWLIWR